MYLIRRARFILRTVLKRGEAGDLGLVAYFGRGGGVQRLGKKKKKAHPGNQKRDEEEYSDFSISPSRSVGFHRNSIMASSMH